MLNIICPQCKEKLSSSEYNTSNLIAQCEACNTVFKFYIKEAMTSDKSYKQVNKPKGIELIENGTTTKIILKHKHYESHIGILILGVFLAIFMYFFIRPSVIETELFAFLIPLLFIFFGLVPRLKKTIVEIKNETIAIERTSPLTFKQDHSFLKKDNIKQLFVRKRKVENDNSTSIFFDLGLEKKDNGVEYIIKNFKSPKPLYFIETTIEQKLGIEDKTHAQESLHLGFLPQSLSEVKDIAMEAYRNRNRNRNKG